MGNPLVIYAASAAAAILALALWVLLARLMRRSGRSRWQAAPLGLTLIVAAAGYGLFWFGFFSSPAMAVQLHAVRLTIAHAAGEAWPFVAAGWLALCGVPLFWR